MVGKNKETRTPRCERRQIMIHNTSTLHGRTMRWIGKKDEAFGLYKERTRLRLFSDGPWSFESVILVTMSLVKAPLSPTFSGRAGRGHERLTNSLGRLLPPPFLTVSLEVCLRPEMHRVNATWTLAVRGAGCIDPRSKVWYRA